MDFRSHIRATVSKMQRGIEIGASYAPILPKAEGYGVYVVDHASHDELRSKYGAMGVDTSRIEPVDAIDDGGEFTQLLEDGQHFDYIVASHVFEHLPDPIHFLQRCDRALGEHGRLILLIPDRRFTFDYLRPVSTTGQLLRAYLAEQRRHDPGALYDHYAGNATRDGVQVWGDAGGGHIAFAGIPAQGYQAAVASNEAYVDCHAWVFTPSSLRLILADLRALGLIGLNEAFFHESIGCEFMLVLSRSAPATAPDRSELAREAIREAARGGVHTAAPAAGGFIDVPAGYVREAPSPQQAVDLFAGQWVSGFPPAVGVRAGDVPLHDDARMAWLLERLGGRAGLDGRDVLELGPLEAAHTRQLLDGGAASVLAVEANKSAYLRCLIAKEILNLDRARFLLGDFNAFLEADTRRWPLVVACGVLYHMADPLRLLELLAGRTDTLYLWTHVIDDAAMPEGDPRRAPVAGVVARAWRDLEIRLHRRPYGPVTDARFCGSAAAEPMWMERAQLLEVLGRLGFDHLEPAHEQPDHAAGPALSILARRPPQNG
ncbi:class I SAM-dependent methyltransferase [Xenophilus azovorans]|uniref:class I SAM-dependent methyltransferase n=1 Tax=Xenophilus TaxID=151754 RepID=UPI000A046B39|nr:class I SAM-dependent methyltransferase [Xenophilus azovorans]